MNCRRALAAWLTCAAAGASASASWVVYRDTGTATLLSVLNRPWWSEVQDPQVLAEAQGILVLCVLIGSGLAKRMCQAANAIKPFGNKFWMRTLRDVRRAGMLKRQGTVFGLFRGYLLIVDATGHLLVLGGSRSGKGVGTVVPTLQVWSGSVVVYDPKGELVQITSGWRSRATHVLIFNPTSPHSAHFNPLLEVRKGPNEIRDAQNIAVALINPDGSKQSLDIWDESTQQLYVIVILFVLYIYPEDAKHLGTVRALILDLEHSLREMAETTQLPGEGNGQTLAEIVRVARGLLNKSERFLTSVQGTAESYLVLWSDPLVVASTARSDFFLSDLMCAEHPVSLYLQTQPSDADRLRPLIRLLLNQLGRALLERPKTSYRGAPKRHRLLLLLDEFPALGRLDFFESQLALMAGYGIKAMLVAQSLGQISARYGRDNGILDNCQHIVVLSCNDPESLQRLSTLTGTATEYRQSFSRPQSPWQATRHTVNESESVRPLLTPGDIRTLPADQALVLASGYPPLRAQKLRYYQDKRFIVRVLPPIDPSQGIDATGPVHHDWQGLQAEQTACPPGHSPRQGQPMTEEASPADSLQSENFIEPTDAARSPDPLSHDDLEDLYL